MNLLELFKKLSYTHLSELSIGGEGSGQVPEEHIPKLVQRNNEGLLAMYARFPLRIKTLTLQTYAAINEYYLLSENSVSAAAPTPYIIDTVLSPFGDDILMIDSIVDAEGETVPFNDPNEETSWHITGYDSISIDAPEDDLLFKIRYRAKPDEIVYGPPTAETTIIPIPRILESALMCYIAGHIYGNMSMEGAMVKSQHFLDMYETYCQDVENRNLLNSSPGFTNQKPELRGWP